VTAKHACLRDILARREQWRDELKLVRRLHGDVLAAAGILSGATLEKEQQRVTNASVQQRYAQWCEELRERLTSTTLSETERRCLSHFLHVTTNMSPQLFNCYDLEAMPRTNNDMEGFIRSVKTRYRRVSGRKNWNRYLIRYGTRVAFYEARSRSGELAEMTAGMDTAGARTALRRQHASRSSSSSIACATSGTPIWLIRRPAGLPFTLVPDYCPDGKKRACRAGKRQGESKVNRASRDLHARR
jgi:hypothetical protein